MIPWLEDLLCNCAAPMCIYSAIHGAHCTQFHHRKASFFILTDRPVGCAFQAYDMQTQNDVFVQFPEI
jgi:hypothetical protein